MELRQLATLICSLFLPASVLAQTFTGGGGPIPDGGPQVSFPVVVSGLPQTTLNGSYGLETVCFNITHTWDSDLNIKLQAPDGTTVSLVYNAGGDGDDFTNTCLNDFATNPISMAGAPFTGTFKPMGIIGNVNNGQNGNGTWNLLIQDMVGSDLGNLIDFSLTFGINPDTPFNFGSTNLPIVIINTVGNIIQDEPKVMAKMGVIYNGIGAPNHPTDLWNNYSGWCGIEYRGSSSGGFPQKSYGIETRDSLGNELTPFILSLPPEQDFALIATFNDKSLMRNVLTYELANQMGDYAPRTRFCEVFVNDEYQGVYMLAEKIKRDPNRVDIANLTPQDISGDDVTGGYILKIDKFTGSSNGNWNSPYAPLDGTGGQTITFQYEYPKQSDLQPEQDDYIKGYIDSFENALASPNFTDTNTGYRHFADINSFIDNFIINEISRNVDGYRLSYYFYKDKNSNGGKLKSGPAWDYNLAWWNADYCNGFADTGWAYRFGVDCPWDGFQVPFWWGRMMEDTNYTNALKCRWEELRASTLSNQHIFAFIDSNAAYLEQAQQRHFVQWPVMGVYTWPNPSPLAQTYAEEITNMKAWITQRMIWLDANMPGTCYPPDTTTPVHIANNIAGDNAFNIYPNPFTDNIKLDLSAITQGDLTVEVYSSVGQLVYSKKHSYRPGKNHYKLDLDDQLAAGVYLFKASTKDYSYSQRIIKQVK
jgi:subtilisin-like proprotein convertase family protein